MNLRPLRWTPAAIVLIAGSTNSLAGGLFGASIELSSLDGTNGFVCNGIDSNDFSGQSVSSAGDVNADGIDDLIIGAHGAGPNVNNSNGDSYVVFGGAEIGSSGTLELSLLNGINGFVLNGIFRNDRSGYSVSSAGDVNGDGIDDIIIGAPDADPNRLSRAGESYIVFGGVGVGAGGAFELSALDGTNGFTCHGIDKGDRSGNSVSSAGDVNGDGIGDIIIGAYYAYQNGQIFTGEAYVVFGGVGVGAGGAIELSSLDGTNGFVLKGIDENDRCGRSVSSAGDVNGDGVGDIIIGANRAESNGTSSGESYVVFGGVGVGAGGSIELSSLNGTNGFVCNGIDEFDYSGYSVSSAGDVNGDGFDDLIIGATNADPNLTSAAGESYVVFGGAGIGSGGAIDLSSLNGANGFVCNGVDTSDLSGVSVSHAGDINSDGMADFLIGTAPVSFLGPSELGKTYTVFGDAEVGSGGSLDLSSLNGANGFVCYGISMRDGAGRSVSSAGDVNGDGVDDILIGARFADPNGQDAAGNSYIVFGRKPCPNDLNADGVVDMVDLGVLIDQFNSPGPGADINNDGVVNSSDLGILIGAFGTTTCD